MKEFDPRQVAFIQLRGEPYQRRVQGRFGIEAIDCNRTLNNLAEDTSYHSSIVSRIDHESEHLRQFLRGEGYNNIDNKLKHGENLTFDDAFSLATFVCAGLNIPLNKSLKGNLQNEVSHETHLLQATALLAAMSAKESYSSLTPDEVAGIVAATIRLDTAVRIPILNKKVLAFGGMGGDKGYPLNGERSKLFSLSTLASVALSVDGPVHKHHSYPNTSKVAGQNAIEAFGARSDFHSIEAFRSVFSDTNLVMSSCHDTRTLHTLSHLLRGETINHVIGPLAFTLSRDTAVQAMIGVNEKIHPETIIEALKVLQEKGFQKYDNSVAYCGTDVTRVIPEMLDPVEYSCSNTAKMHVLIDEVAPVPYVTLAAFLVKGENMGTFALYPEDFYTEDELMEIPFQNLTIHNSIDDIMYYNGLALEGKDIAKSRYLAMTIGLGLFVRYGLDKVNALNRQSKRVNKVYLREYTKIGYEILVSGLAQQQMRNYIESTNQHAGIRQSVRFF